MLFHYTAERAALQEIAGNVFKALREPDDSRGAAPPLSARGGRRSAPRPRSAAHDGIDRAVALTPSRAFSCRNAAPSAWDSPAAGVWHTRLRHACCQAARLFAPRASCGSGRATEWIRPSPALPLTIPAAPPERRCSRSKTCTFTSSPRAASCARSKACPSTVHPGEMVALVGESGCGKSVSSLADHAPAREARRAHRRAAASSSRAATSSSSPKTRCAQIRGRDISMIFQEPMTSLNPVLTIGLQIMEPLLIHLGHERGAGAQRARSSCCGWSASPTPQRRLDQYPHQFSGGMRQRVMIAIGLACNPEAHHRRRADHRARRHDPGADPEAHEGPVARARHRDGGHHAQPRHRRALRRPRERDVRGAHGRAGHAPRASSRSRSIPTPRACCARCRGSTGRAARSSRRSRACRRTCSSRRRAAASRRAARRKCRKPARSTLPPLVEIEPAITPPACARARWRSVGPQGLGLVSAASTQPAAAEDASTARSRS